MILTSSIPRLLRGIPGTPLSLAEHEATFVKAPRTRTLFEELQASGLSGRGGAAFSTAMKVALLRDLRHHKVVVVNAMEGEPASHKDAALLSTNPHLVLDGAEALAAMIGTKDVIVCVARDNHVVATHVARAIAERTHTRGCEFVLQTPPGRYVAGEESALVHWLNENESLPQYRPQRPHILKIHHRPVLVDNAETCAHVGLIARSGAEWFRSLGTAESPGSTLVSLTGAVERPTVLEVPLGMALGTILEAGRAEDSPRALLLGGYGGTWFDAGLDIPYANESLRPLGATVGAGVIVVLGHDGCGIYETERVVQWMANESARQCGPCAFGLPALAEDLRELRRASSGARDALDSLRRRCGVIDGRGACRHPDGVVRLVRSALQVFDDDVRAHASGRACAGASSTRHFASVPRLEHESDLEWE